MIAVRRRAKPEIPAFEYNEVNRSSVYGVPGITARSNIVE
jgi:hypothetical protein